MRARHLVEACEHALEVERLKGRVEPQWLGRIQFELARQFEGALAEPERALEHYKRALAQRPEHAASLRGLRVVHLLRGEFAEAGELLEREVKLTADAARRAELVALRAELLTRMGKPQDARRTHAEAAALAPGLPELEYAVVLAERAAGQSTTLAASYERLARDAEREPALQALWHFERARVLEGDQSQTAAAIDGYRRALALAPRTLGVLAALERLYWKTERFEELQDLLDVAAEQTDDSLERGWIRARRARVLLDRLARLGEGAAELERALSELPGELGLIEELAVVYECTGDAAKLAATLERLYMGIGEPERRSGLALRIARLQETELKDEGRATLWYSRELERSPTCAEAVTGLCALYERRGQWEPLVAVRLAEAEALQDGLRRGQAFAELARIVEERLARPDDAARLNARACIADPGNAGAFASLVRLYLKAGRHAELVELYSRAADGAEDAEERVTYLFKLGRLLEDAVGDAAGALAVYRRIGAAATPAVEALHSMQRAAAQAGRYAEVVEGIELELKASPSLARRVRLLEQRAALETGPLSAGEAGVATYQRLLELAPRHEAGLLGLARELAAAGRWDEWLEIQRRRVELLPTEGDKAEVLFEMAQVLELRTGARRRAMELLKEVLTLVPAHRGAELGLERLLWLESLWPDLVQLLSREVASYPNSVSARRLARAAELLEHRLGQSRAALKLYNQALEKHPGFAPALDGCERLHSLARESEALARHLMARAQSASGRSAAVRFHHAALVYRDELQRPVDALGAAEALAQLEPDNIVTSFLLEPLRGQQGTAEGLVATLRTLCAVLKEPRTRIAALQRLAAALERISAPAAERLGVLVAVLELDPGHIPVLERLEWLARAGADSSLLAQVDARLGSLLVDGGARCSHLTRLADTLETQGDPAALGVYAAALELDGESVAATRGLGRLAAERSETAPLVLAAEHELRVLRDHSLAASWLLRASSLAETSGALENARGLAERALATAPELPAAAERLSALLRASGEIDRLVAALTAAAGHCKVRERTAELWIVSARLLANEKADLPAAIAALTRVTQFLATALAPQAELAALLARDGQYLAARERYEKALGLAATLHERSAMRLALAELLNGALRNPEQAANQYEAVLEEAPSDTQALLGLFQLRVNAGALEAAAPLAERLVDVVPAGEPRANAQISLARLEAMRAHFEVALAAYAGAMEWAGLGGPAASELRGMIAAHPGLAVVGWGQYSLALRRYLEGRVGDAAASSSVLRELARVFDVELGQPAEAARFLEADLAKASTDPRLWAELGHVLERSGEKSRSLDAYRRALDSDAAQPEVLRGIVRCLDALGRASDARTAEATLLSIGAASDLEAARLSSRIPLAGQLAPRVLDGDLLAVVGAPAASDPVLALVVAMAEGLERVEEPDLERYGLTSRDRLTARSGAPIRGLAECLAQACAIDEYELYVAPGAVPSGGVDAGASLLVPATIQNESEAVQAFALSRVLVPMARRYHAMLRFDDAVLGEWVLGACRLANESYGVGTGDDDLIGNRARRLAKALPWGRRGRVEEAAQAWMAAGSPAIAPVAARVRLASARLALLVADDLPAVVRWLRVTEGDQAGLAPQQTMLGIALMHEMIRFWQSEVACELRRRLGIA